MPGAVRRHSLSADRTERGCRYAPIRTACRRPGPRRRPSWLQGPRPPPEARRSCGWLSRRIPARPGRKTRINEPNPHPAAQTGVLLIPLPPAEPCRRSPVRGHSPPHASWDTYHHLWGKSSI